MVSFRAKIFYLTKRWEELTVFGFSGGISHRVKRQVVDKQTVEDSSTTRAEPNSVSGTGQTKPDQVLGAANADKGQVLGAPQVEPGQVFGTAKPEPDQVLGAPQAEPDQITGTGQADTVQHEPDREMGTALIDRMRGLAQAVNVENLDLMVDACKWLQKPEKHIKNPQQIW